MKNLLLAFFLIHVTYANAQNYLPSYLWQKTKGVFDYVIPHDIASISFELKGAQGGGETVACNFRGGFGGGIKGQVIVGNCGSPQLKTGGLLRLVIGEMGESVTSSPVGGGAGGGGGTAMLYQPPNSSEWIIIAVGGGGGGAMVELNGGYFQGDCSGIGLNGTDAADLSGNGLGGAEAAGGYGGGGYAANAPTIRNVACTGKKGFPAGGPRADCTDHSTFYGGFGFGSGGSGLKSGGGGGGYTGGRYGQGGSSFQSSYIRNIESFKGAGGGYIMLFCTTANNLSAVSIASSILNEQEVIGCSITQCADFGLSTSQEKSSDLASFNAAGGVVNPGGCPIQLVSYIDSLVSGNPNLVNRTWKLTDAGQNVARATQKISIVRPSLLAGISPENQTTCINLSPGTITATASSQFGITAKWYISESAIFSEASEIPGALSLSYKPSAQAVDGVYYYFCRITDGCGGAKNQVSSVYFTPQAQYWYKDIDGDNYYDPAGTVLSCTLPGSAYKSTGMLGADCSDFDKTIYPGSMEICDGKDNDCDGLVDELCCPAGNIIYVKADATGANNGSSWANAYTSLQAALSITCAHVTQVWVARGTYKPTTTTDRTIAFVMKNNVAIYGGFNGTETQIKERNTKNNVTILSGDIGVAGNFSDNSYNVIRNDNNGITSSAKLDGFTVTGGNANNGTAYFFSRGGGIACQGTSPTIRNCFIYGNNALYYGGGIFLDHSSSQLVNDIIAGNTASYGGGLYNEVANPEIINCTISGNLASSNGGAMHNYGYVSPQVKNSILWGNSSGVSNNLSTPGFANSIVQTSPSSPQQDSVFIEKPVPGLNNIGDLRLPPCSPAVDAGNSTFFPYTDVYTDFKDIEENFRIFTQQIDIGAYERYYPLSITYVNIAATGRNDGSSWANAYTTLDKAVREMNYCENKVTSGTIYIAKGIYPLNGTSVTLLNRSNAVILGGFQPDGTERNPLINQVTIIGNLRAGKSLQLDGVILQKPVN